MNRNKTIDNLRGLAMLSMIIGHVTAYFLNDKTAFLIWDLGEWSVVTFLFCSAYLFYSRDFVFDIKNIIAYIKKRFSRLYLPYFYFLLFLFPLRYFFYSKKIDIGYISKSIFFVGGIDLNWLVLIFFQLMFVFPLVYFFKKKNKLLYWLYFILSLMSSVYYLYLRNWDYRKIMWLPWSLVIYFTIFIIDNQKNWKKIAGLGILSFLVFFATRFLLSGLGHNLTQYYNKYPPNLYHLSYGILSTIILYFLSEKGVFNFLNFQKILDFLSTNSYSLFFIHNLIIFMFTWLHWLPSNWFLFFLEIFGLSSLIQLGFNNFQKLKSRILPVKSFSNRGGLDH